MAEKNMNAKISVEFEETANRQQLSSGDNLPTLFGKIKKIISDLSTSAFSGSYNDLSDKPTTATTETDGFMSADDKSKLDSADDTYALKSKYGDTTIDVGRKLNTTVGAYSIAEGYNTTASGHSSHAEGFSTTASGHSSHAEGFSTTASGHSSHAEGVSKTASGDYSHAEGVNTTASGSASHSEGVNTTASGSASHAGGYHTKALHDYEVANGKFNQSNSDTLYSIGDGTADDARHNAFEITTTGGKLHDEEIMTQNKISNPNLLINPDFKINQRGVSGTFSEMGKYFVDRWRLVSGAVTVNADGTLTLNGTISQILENAVGDNVTASVSAGTAVYDNSTKTFSITANGEIISWAKLEYGSNATQFFPPDPTTELLKCKRYFETKSISAKGLAPDDLWIEGHIFDVPKRAIPSISLTSLLGTPDTLSGITGADSEIKIVGYPIVAVDRIHGSSCSKALGYITYSYRYTADAEIY